MALPAWMQSVSTRKKRIIGFFEALGPDFLVVSSDTAPVLVTYVPLGETRHHSLEFVDERGRPFVFRVHPAEGSIFDRVPLFFTRIFEGKLNTTEALDHYQLIRATITSTIREAALTHELELVKAQVKSLVQTTKALQNIIDTLSVEVYKLKRAPEKEREPSEDDDNSAVQLSFVASDDDYESDMPRTKRQRRWDKENLEPLVPY